MCADGSTGFRQPEHLLKQRAKCERLSSRKLLATSFASVDSSIMIAKAKQWARGIKRDILAVWIAARDSRTPWYAKAMAAAVAAYALSPIDLIPDFIPVLGYLDDLLLLPIGILLVVLEVAELDRQVEDPDRESQLVIFGQIGDVGLGQ